MSFFLHLCSFRNSDCISNYVDRVRICDTKSIESESVYSKASQKSGWRQKSYSNIDLSSTGDHLPGAGAFRYRDFDAQDDSGVNKNDKDNEIQRDYEDIYNVNLKGNIYCPSLLIFLFYSIVTAKHKDFVNDR